jgi:DNA-directed RNA polymerase subunit RPC12/RpoP
MSIGATVICKKCRQKVPLNSVRYDQNGRDLICFDCHDKQEWALKKAGFAERREPASTVKLSTIAKAEKPPVAAKPVEAPRKTGERSKYFCTSCRYKFTLKKGAEAKKCPYCGKETLEQDNFDLNNLISESDLSKDDE